MSSRNQRLNEEQRRDAPRIRRALLAASHLQKTGEQNREIYLNAAREHLNKNALQEFKIQYLELVDQATLQPIAKVTAPAILAAACFYDSIRLIDHVSIDPTKSD